jgi:hypothetical protein
MGTRPGALRVAMDNLSAAEDGTVGKINKLTLHGTSWICWHHTMDKLS